MCTVCGAEEKAPIDRIEIDIHETDQYGLCHFTVVDSKSLESIADASVFITTEKDGENTFTTDEQGKLSVVLPAEKVSVSVYAENYHVRNLKYTIKPGEQDIPLIGISNDEIVSATLSSEPMTLEQAKQAGIDVSDESNQQIWKWELKLVFTAHLEWEFEYYTVDGKVIPGAVPGGSTSGISTVPTAPVVRSTGFVEHKDEFSTNIGVRPAMKLNRFGYTRGDTLSFGSYPQQRVADEDTVRALNALVQQWKPYAIYAGNGNLYSAKPIEGMTYADVTLAGVRYRAVRFSQYRPHATYEPAGRIHSFQDENAYEADTVYWFRYSPIEWTVLQQQEDGVLVLTNRAIDSQSYDLVQDHITYEDADIRQWLNEDFYDAAFTATEQKSILTSKVDLNEFGSVYVYDKLFLLSEDDVYSEEYGFFYKEINEDGIEVQQTNWELLCARGTDYAAALGIHDPVYEENPYEAYWLRDFIYSGGSGMSGSGGMIRLYGRGGSGGGSGPGIYVPAYIDIGSPELFYLVIWGEVRWVKEMFDVEMVVVNNSNIETDTVESTATLHLPDGLSLAAMKQGGQTLSQTVLPVGAGQSQSVHWYVRGDKQGDYTVTAALDGMIMPGEETFSYQYTCTNAMHVYAGSAMHMTFTIPEAAYEGFDYVVKIELENVSDKTLYGVSSKITDVFQYDSYYMEGDPKGLYYHAKGGEKVPWQQGYAEKFEPGDKIILEMSSNILFHSRQIDEMLKGIVDNVEKYKKMYDYCQDLMDIGSALTDVLTAAGDGIDAVLDASAALLPQAKVQGYIALGYALEQLGEAISDVSPGIASAVATRIMNSDTYQTLLKMTNQNQDPDAVSLSECTALTAQINTILRSLAENQQDDPFELIRNVVSILPVRFCLEHYYVSTRDGSTTTIPSSVIITPVTSPYKGVFNTGKILYNSVIAAMGKMDVDAIYRFFGAPDDPTGYGNACEYLKTVVNQYHALNVRVGERDTRVRAWVVPAKANGVRAKAAALPADGTTYSDGWFELYAEENDTAKIVDGKLEFIGNATLKVKALSLTGGTLYVDLGGATIQEFEIEPVEEHVCAGSRWTSILSPTAESAGYSALYCDKCDDLLDFRADTLCTEHTFDDWTVETAPTCEENGSETRICSVCGYTESRLTAASGHIPDDWMVVRTATAAQDGLREQRCTVCDTVLHSEAIPFVAMEKMVFDEPEVSVETDGEAKLNITITPSNATQQKLIWTTDHPEILTVDENGVVTPHTTGTATVTVQTEDGSFSAVCVVTVRVKQYNVQWIIDGTVKTETYTPGEPIRVPANPTKDGFTFKGWTPAVPATMPVNDMSFKAMFEKIPDPIIKIHNYTSSRTVDYRTTLTFTAEVTNTAPDASVHWFINGQDKGASDTYTEKEAKATFTVQAKYMKGTTVLAESETETVNVKTSFFAKLVAFFRALFGRLPKVVQEYLGIEIIERVLS